MKKILITNYEGIRIKALGKGNFEVSESKPYARLDQQLISMVDYARNILKMNGLILDEKILERYARSYGVKLDSARISTKFNELIRKLSKKYKKGVVVLIDEYDKPIISNLGKDIDDEEKKRLKIAKENQEFLKTLYDNLKPLESYLRLVFITGVSKFSKVSIFSTLNNVIEIDKEPVFAEIMGYTEKELYNYFDPYFEKLADNYGIKVNEAKAKFKRMYDGFRFTEKDVRVYNPYSTGLSLNYSRLDDYWFESGAPTFLVDLIKEKGFDITRLNNLEVGRNKLKAYDITKLKLIPILFQTGYLTIKDIEDNIIYTQGYPNYEVERGLTQNLLEEFTDDRVDTPIIHRLKKSLLKRDYERFIEYMKSLFASIANINIPKSLQDREHYYHSIFYLVEVLFSDDNLNVYSELLTSAGRIDMLVETEENIFIIEFKCNASAEEAIKQIQENKYTDKYKIKEKDIVLIGINFDTDKKNLGDYLIV